MEHRPEPTVVEQRVVGKGHFGLAETGALCQREHGAQIEEERVGPVERAGAESCARGGGEDASGERRPDGVLAVGEERLGAVLRDVRCCDAVEDHGELLGGDHEDPCASVYAAHPVDHVVRGGRLGGLGRLRSRLDDVVAPDEEGAEQPRLPVKPDRVGAGVRVAVEAPGLRRYQGAELCPPSPG